MWHPIVTLCSRAALSVRARQRGCAALAGNIVLRSHAAWQPVSSRWFLFTPHLLLDRGDFVKNSAFRRNMTQFLDNLPALWYCSGILHVSKLAHGEQSAPHKVVLSNASGRHQWLIDRLFGAPFSARHLGRSTLRMARWEQHGSEPSDTLQRCFTLHRVCANRSCCQL